MSTNICFFSFHTLPYGKHKQYRNVIYMDMNDEDILEDFGKTRGLSQKSIGDYRSSIKAYRKYFNTTLQELLTEAEQEEEKGIRWKNRTLKRRLLEYRSYLSEKYLRNTARNHFLRIITICRHYEIEVHQLPRWNEKSMNIPKPINYSDLPDKEIIKEAVRISNNLMKAIILFMSSSGTARREALNLTLDDFIEATSQYHQETDIYGVIKALDGKEDVIPTFRLRRQKTNKHYYTFCSPEATQEIVNYLKGREKLNEGRLFKTNTRYFTELFGELNDKMNLGKVGTYNRFRSHMLRKYHASQLYNNGMRREIVDALQGRGKSSTHSSYFMEDPEKLKQEYVNHLDCLMINWNSIDYKSPEYIELERVNKENEDKIANFEERLARLESLENSSRFMNRNQS